MKYTHIFMDNGTMLEFRLDEEIVQLIITAFESGSKVAFTDEAGWTNVLDMGKAYRVETC